MKTSFTTVDEYIASCPEETRGRLQEIRAAIRAAVPDAKEKISYQIACFELNGKNLVHFAGWKNHVSIYPTPEGTAAFNKAIAKYAGGKGTTKFLLDEPLPLKLIGQIVKFRVADNLKNEKLKKGKIK
ncbi:MAG: DUF1801 domain-containing protein [Chloroflexi bacterium]|nr:DUF1801 domain-containing protein [Chloroflexota bacterium]